MYQKRNAVKRDASTKLGWEEFAIGMAERPNAAKRDATTFQGREEYVQDMVQKKSNYVVKAVVGTNRRKIWTL